MFFSKSLHLNQIELNCLAPSSMLSDISNLISILFQMSTRLVAITVAEACYC